MADSYQGFQGTMPNALGEAVSGGSGGNDPVYLSTMVLTAVGDTLFLTPGFSTPTSVNIENLPVIVSLTNRTADIFFDGGNKTTIDGNLLVNGSFSTIGNINTGSNIRAGGNITVGNNATVSGDATVNGAITTSQLLINPNNTFANYEDSYINGTLYVGYSNGDVSPLYAPNVFLNVARFEIGQLLPVPAFAETVVINSGDINLNTAGLLTLGSAVNIEMATLNPIVVPLLPAINISSESDMKLGATFGITINGGTNILLEGEEISIGGQSIAGVQSPAEVNVAGGMNVFPVGAPIVPVVPGVINTSVLNAGSANVAGAFAVGTVLAPGVATATFLTSATSFATGTFNVISVGGNSFTGGVLGNTFIGNANFIGGSINLVSSATSSCTLKVNTILSDTGLEIQNLSSVNGLPYAPGGGGASVSTFNQLFTSSFKANTAQISSISSQQLFISSINGLAYPPTTSGISSFTTASVSSLFVSSINNAVYPPPAGNTSAWASFPAVSTIQVPSPLGVRTNNISAYTVGAGANINVASGLAMASGQLLSAPQLINVSSINSVAYPPPSANVSLWATYQASATVSAPLGINLNGSYLSNALTINGYTPQFDTGYVASGGTPPTFTIAFDPTKVVAIDFLLIGGGGGGGGGGFNNGGGGGGGSGTYLQGTIGNSSTMFPWSVPGISSITCTLGAGGTGFGLNGQTGLAGGDSFFTVNNSPIVYRAKGGFGGNGSQGQDPTDSGGNGGAGGSGGGGGWSRNNNNNGFRTAGGFGQQKYLYDGSPGGLSDQEISGGAGGMSPLGQYPFQAGITGGGGGGYQAGWANTNNTSAAINGFGGGGGGANSDSTTVGGNNGGSGGLYLRILRNTA